MCIRDRLDIPVIRLERRYPPRDESLVWCDTFDDAIDYLESHEINHLLALSGVQTINKLRRYWEKHPCHFRVLDREDSRSLARQAGFPEKNLLFWHEEQDELFLLYTSDKPHHPPTTHSTTGKPSPSRPHRVIPSRASSGPTTKVFLSTASVRSAGK